MKSGVTTYQTSSPTSFNPKRRNLPSKMGKIIKKLGAHLTKKTSIVEMICALLIILFIYTGLNKLMDIDKFQFEMGRSPFIQDFASIIAYTLPVGEIILAIFLIMKKTKLLGLYLSFTLMAVFTGYIWLMLNYAYDLPCSCGGIISQMTWQDHLIFNSIFTALSFIAIILQNRVNKDRLKPTA